MTADPSRARSWTSLLIRVIVAAVLIGLAVRNADLRQIGDQLTGAAPAWLGAALGLVLVDRTLNAWRWIRLLRAVEPGPPRPLGQLVRIFFVSTFLGTFLPAGSAGGDAIRAIGVSRLQVPGADAVGSVVVDRLLGVISILLMAVAGLWFAGGLVPGRIVLAAVALTVAAAVAALLLLFDSRLLTGLVGAAARHRLPRIERLAGKALAGIRQFGHKRGLLLRVLAASLLVQVLRVLQAWCLGLSLGLGIGGIWYFAFVPVIVLIMQLPIAFNGIGPGNLAFVELFEPAGVDPSQAFALSVLFLALGWFGNLPGALVMIKTRRF